MIKTFRGLLGDGVQDKILLRTNDGSTGYRIVKFEIIPEKPGETAVYYESVVKIWKIDQTTQGRSVDAVIDFSDNTLMAAALFGADTATHAFYGPSVIIFDQEVFNQDIYITNKDIQADAGMNYYIELEQIKLDLSESTVATLKDIRNLEYPAPGG